MAWVRIDDGFTDHPKALGAGWMALGLWLEGMCYTNRHLTDGILTKAVVAKFRGGPRPLKLAAELVSVGLWDVIEGGWRIHDYHDYNPSAAEVKGRRALDSARKRRGIPHGFRPDSGVGSTPDSVGIPDPRARAGDGVGLDKALDGQWSGAEFWEIWTGIANRHGVKPPLMATPNEYTHIRALLESYSRDELQQAMRVWWESPHVGGRNIGLFRTQVGEALQHIASGSTVPFRAPKQPPTSSQPESAKSIAARIAAREGWA